MSTFGEFLDLKSGWKRSSKERHHGITMLMDQGWSTDFTSGMLDGYGAYIDIVKFWDPMLLQPLNDIRRRIELYRSHDVIVQPGGYIIELARAQNKADETLDKMIELGFTAIEISSTTSTRGDMSEDLKLVGKAKEAGLKVYGEVGRKFADGDETRLTDRTLDISRTVEEFEILLKSGAQQVYWEGHLLRIVMGDDPETIKNRADTGTQQVLEVVRQVGLDSIIFEVSGLRPRANRQWLQFWLVRLFGPEVNIANARIEEMANLEALRGGTHPIFGFGSAGNYPAIREVGNAHDEWWRR